MQTIPNHIDLPDDCMIEGSLCGEYIILVITTCFALTV